MCWLYSSLQLEGLAMGSVFDAGTLSTGDPFIAGWFLSAYFLGGYVEDGRGMNGYSNAVIAAAKSWALGIPVGVGIRAVTIGHLPLLNFILVTTDHGEHSSIVNRMEGAFGLIFK